MKNRIKDFASILLRPTLNKIHKFKDAHKGETCYIMGDGISVKWFDLSAFSDKISIPVTYIPFHNDFDKLQAKYLILSEPYYFYPYFKTTVPPFIWWRNRIQLAYRDIIKSNRDKEFFINASNLPVLSGKNVTFIFQKIYDSRLSNNFISNKIDPYHGSLRASITLASYLGFIHVYLIGCDYTHSPSRSLHWYEKGEGIIGQNHEYQEDFFKIAANFIDITTVTLNGGSNCSSINSITYEKLTGLKPSFTENINLISGKYLRLLDTWPDYNIF